MQTKYDIYYYWDDVHGKDSLSPYLQLCINTWEKNAQAENIIKVNIDNIHSYSHGLLDAHKLSKFTPAQRSDAAMVCVMMNRRGIFMDIDSVIMPNFNADKYFSKTVPSLYAIPRLASKEPLLAFLANPNLNDTFLENWRNQTIKLISYELNSPYRKLRRLFREVKGKKVHVPWHYLGANIMKNMASVVNNNVNTIDACQTGFCPNVNNEFYGDEMYMRFWYNEHDYHPEILHKDGIVALQNSWMPQNIKSLPSEKFLEGDLPINKLFQYALL